VIFKALLLNAIVNAEKCSTPHHKRIMLGSLISVLSLSFLIGIKAEQDIIGCGGFVQSNVHIDFDRVEVKLYTKQGAFKFKTECAPNNGYFLVAVYDKGDYTLRIEPPGGWGFSPTEIDLAIDGSTDPCSKGEDLNFKFTGFTLRGLVGSLGKEDGPAGVNVKLYAEGNEQMIAESTSQHGGTFIFENTMPGKYLVKASHSSWTFSKEETLVEIINDNSADVRDLMVFGYDVKGSVVSGGEPIQGVFFILFSPTEKQSLNQCEDLTEDIVKNLSKDIQGTPICKVTSNEKGEFFFPVVPSSEYTLVPFYMSRGNIFDVVPSKLSFSVNYKSVVLKTPFQVYGFVVTGKVVDGSGKAMPHVSVILKNSNGDVRSAKSDEEGNYKMDNVTTGNYEVNLEKEKHLFDTERVYVTPNTPSLPVFSSKKYSICGSIDVVQLPHGVLPVHQRKVFLQPVGASNTEIVSKMADPSGAFCFLAPPGKYKIEVMISSTELKKGFILKPRDQAVDVVSEPVSGIQFKQFRASVTGKLKCIGSCEDSVVHMTPLDNPSSEKIYAEVQKSPEIKESSFAFF